MRLIVFDLDHTLLTANSSFRFGAYLYRQGVYSSWTLVGCLVDYARHKWMGMSIFDLHQKIFIRLFKGLPLVDIHRFAAQFASESLEAMLYPPTLLKLKEALARKDHVVILSSSPDFLVGEIAHHLEVEHWKATVYQSDEKGELCAISEVMEGENKADHLKKLSDKLEMPQSAITVYSDSYLDLPMLKMAGEAIAVRPDFRLKRICLENGWEIL